MHSPHASTATKVRNLPRPDRATRYQRATDLPKLIGLWPCEIADTTLKGRARLISKLKGALRAERLRGLGGHWAYDLARHYQLLTAYKCEVAALSEISNGKARRALTKANWPAK